MFFLMFIFERETERQRDRETETECEWGRSREGDTDSKAGSRLRAVSTEPDAGLELISPQVSFRRQTC